MSDQLDFDPLRALLRPEGFDHDKAAESEFEIAKVACALSLRKPASDKENARRLVRIERAHRKLRESYSNRLAVYIPGMNADTAKIAKWTLENLKK